MSSERKEKVLCIFVIDTDSYAGNFEREMTAYMTGRIGDCEVGDDNAKIFYEELGLHEPGNWDWNEVSRYEDLKNPFDFIVDEPDDHGTLRPTSIYPSNYVKDAQGTWPQYNSVAIYMERVPSEEERKILIERAAKFAENPSLWRMYKSTEDKIKILGFRFFERRTIEEPTKRWTQSGDPLPL
jgi:hypothetical protein